MDSSRSARRGSVHTAFARSPIGAQIVKLTSATSSIARNLSSRPELKHPMANQLPDTALRQPLRLFGFELLDIAICVIVVAVFVGLA